MGGAEPGGGDEITVRTAEVKLLARRGASEGEISSALPEDQHEVPESAAAMPPCCGRLANTWGGASTGTFQL